MSACEVCGKLIPERPHQAWDARTCTPKCAGLLFKRENPDHGRTTPSEQQGNRP